MKHLAIFGSTGSIGQNALKIVEAFPERFTVDVLAAKSNTALLASQVRTFGPEVAVVYDDAAALDLKKRLGAGAGVEILYGEEGYRAAASHGPVEMVVTAVVGAAGLMPTLEAVRSGKDIALANKETLVMAGDIVMGEAAARGVRILPVDSEHSAVFQCIEGNRKEDLDRIILTASGGPFLNRPASEFVNIGPEDALNHPTWRMGKKISIDSATLMNKGLEVVEAKYFFGLPQDRIEVIVHPQSVVHSMVAYRDGSIIAQLGVPDMKGAIAYALSYPERLPLNQPLPDFARIGALNFAAPDFEKFPCLALAFDACRIGGTLPAVLNAANEVAVQAFLDRRMPFVDIPVVIRDAMERHRLVEKPSLTDILEADRQAREQAEKVIAGKQR